MNSMKFTHKSSLRGELTVPGDKSISHRSVMFGALADGLTEIHGFLQGADCLSTISCFSKMGISIENQGETVLVHGRGLHGLTAPDSVLDCGNSGTTTRLISGILSAQPFDTVLTGDASIQKRPMKRIIDPLSQMGAKIESVNGNGCAPLHITGSPLHGIHYNSPVASAQVKSSILLAGLYAEGETRVTEPYISRDHSERMLSAFGADIHTEGTTAILQPAKQLYGQKILVPGDISSAAFFIAAGLIVPDSEILIRNVGINPTRDGILRVCKAMNADVELLNVNPASGEPTAVLRVCKAMNADVELLNVNTASGEPTADLLVRSGKLTGTAIEGAIIPTLIDELPVIAAMACYAEGTTVIRDAAELKVKESNRIAVMVENLTAMGADVTETEDGMIIHGGKPLHGAVIDSKKDHRIAMTFAVAALSASGETEILDADCVNISYPGFYGDLERLCK